MNKAFFLDRDGTINVDYNFVHRPEEWTWCDNVIKALQWIQNQNYKIIVVTNQSGIARGRYTEDQVQILHKWVDKQLAEKNISIDGWYYAPHHPTHDPDKKFAPEDRKPGTGMFKKAARKHHIDFTKSYMAGDKITDLKPAIELGMTPFFIRSRHEANQDGRWLKNHNLVRHNTLFDAIQTLR